jgi:hypothetical protein
MGFLDKLEDPLDLAGKGANEAAIRAGELQAAASREAAQIAAGAQEKSLAALTEQLGLTRGAFAPFLAAGTEALGGVQRGATLGGLEQSISDILGGGAFGGLADERRRAVEGQLAAGGLTRSGAGVEAAAAVPTDLAFMIENLLSGRQQNLAQTGLSAAAQTGGQGGGLTSQIVNTLTGGAQSAGAGILGAAQATASGILGGAQAQAQGKQNLLNLGGGLLALFSDPRLKENIRPIGKAGNLDLVEWDWKPEFKDTIVDKFPTMGFLSTQVREFYPELVGEFGGYDVIDYPALHKELLCH